MTTGPRYSQAGLAALNARVVPPPAPPAPFLLNLDWTADLGNGDEALLESRDPERCLAGMRALYELTPAGELCERSQVLYPAGTL